MIQTTTQKIVVSLIVIFLLVILGYFLFNNSSTTVTPAELSEEEVLGEDILTLAYKIESISIDDSVFTSPVFLSLVDYQIPLSPEEQGRQNPFASIGAEAVVGGGLKVGPR